MSLERSSYTGFTVLVQCVCGGGGGGVHGSTCICICVCVGGGGGSAWVYMYMYMYVCVWVGGARFYMYYGIISNISTVSNNRTPWGGIQKIKCSVSIISTLCKFIICTGEKNPEMCVSDMNLAWQQASEMKLK